MEANGLKLDRPSGLWHRAGDKLIIDEVKTVYGPVPVQPGDVLLDLGAHIGAASRLLLDKGIKHTIAVEADPTNIPMLRKNLAGRPASILWAAVGPKTGRTEFYTRADRGFVGSILADPDRVKLTVPMVSLEGLLKQYHPTIVKADIEFAEYGLPALRALPAFVRVVTMEVHVRFIGIFTGRTMGAVELRQRRETAAQFIADIEAQGFREIYRKDKQAKPGEPPAKPDKSGLEPMTKAIVATWAR